MKIIEVQIKNFRSIRNLTLSAKDFNVIVGLNDVGKSNILRALNLFFNNQTDNGSPFLFDHDFSYHFPEKSKRTKEIIIAVKFDVPSSFKEHGTITWQRAWRKSGALDDIFLNQDGNSLPSSSRVPLALKSIRYRYVPAVKSREYYKELLVELYHTLSESLRVPLQESTEDFAESIKKSTNQLTKGLLESLSLQSVLTVPENLQEFFKSLIFETQAASDSFKVALDQRGDGIQARHIPQILKFIAEEDKNTRTKGAPRVSTIWGYEEPENGLELSKAFETAHEFSKISNDIQIFVTTHSPAFYIEAQHHSSSTLSYIKKESQGETKILSKTDTNFLNEQLGIMPLIAPYINEKIEKISSYKKIIKDNFLCDLPTIAVEGESDKRYLTKAINLFSPTLANMLSEQKLRILSSQSSGGALQLYDWSVAWCHAGFSSRLFLLLDNDSAGKNCKSKLSNNDKVKAKLNAHLMKVILLPLPNYAKVMAQKRIYLPVSIENMISSDFWTVADTLGWLEDVQARSLREVLTPSLPADLSLNQYIQNIRTELSENQIYLNKTVKDHCKANFCTRCLEESDTNPHIFDNLRELVNIIEEYFV